MLEQEIKEFLLSRGVSDVGFACIDNADTGDLKYAVSIVVKLSDAIIDEIDELLAKHYGFTEEELDFIINYDIKYRMGDELNA